jgi:putative phosphoribosyl transferase
VGDRRFADRHDAGRRLAHQLESLRPERPAVFGIPRGGVPVAAEVASALEAPLDVVVVRKIGAPANPEFGIGAVAEGGVGVIGEEAVRALGIGPDELQQRILRAEKELGERLARYRGPARPVRHSPPAHPSTPASPTLPAGSTHPERGLLPAHPSFPVKGRTAIVVDDGLATGHTARAAARSLRERGAARVILAVPVAAPRSVAELGEDVDDVVCVEAPLSLWAIGLWYEDFAPTSDEEVTALLDEALARMGGPAPPRGSHSPPVPPPHERR